MLRIVDTELYSPQQRFSAANATKEAAVTPVQREKVAALEIVASTPSNGFVELAYVNTQLQKKQATTSS